MRYCVAIETLVMITSEMKVIKKKRRNIVIACV